MSSWRGAELKHRDNFTFIFNNNNNNKNFANRNTNYKKNVSTIKSLRYFLPCLRPFPLRKVIMNY